MSRRFVNLMVQRCIGHYPASTLHRINPWKCFYPTTREALAAADAAANNKTMVEDVRLPRAAISFYQPCTPGAFVDMHFSSFGRNSNDIISMDHEGKTVLYDAAASAVRLMPAPHAPKHCPVSVTVGDGLYLLDRNPDIEYHPFEALVQCSSGDSSEEEWYWRSLSPPPYAAKDDDEYGAVEDKEEYSRHCYQMHLKDPYIIRAYTVVDDSQIWISTEGGGTFSFHTTSGLWNKAGDWALPFHGHVDYVPELGLWFGFSSRGSHFAASDLNVVSAASPPVLENEWDELAQPLPKQWVQMMAYLLPLGSGKFCVARIFEMADEDWSPLNKGKDYKCEDTFVVFTGVEVQRGSEGVLRMIRHKSRRYSLDQKMAELL